MPGMFWDGYTIKSPTRVNFIDYYSLSNRKCAEMEIQWLKCADRVGLMNSKERCKEIFEDYKECTWQIKAKQRASAIKTERILQNRPAKNVKDEMRVNP